MRFTAYVDAIRQSNTISLNGIGAETRRPLGTSYHVNQYQRNLDLFQLQPLGGNPVPGSEVEHDWTNAIPGVRHDTIDDEEPVLDLLEEELHTNLPTP